jgi:D-alanyl-D-alanine carboxypeptidase (penicillin-binding protein 5/6)
MIDRATACWRFLLPCSLGVLVALIPPTDAAAQTSAAAASPYPGGAAAYVVEVDGKTLWSRNADRPLPPASLTKLMTALLVIESGQSLDDLVTMSAKVARATGARLGLRRGERLRVRDLLTAALLDSANDACLALAEQVGGNEARFVLAMNQRAAGLGLAHTHFANACGHDEPTHRSSAHDLAELAKEAMRQPAIAELVGLVRSHIQTQAGRSWDLLNTNELVGRYPGAVGIKTGFTAKAGKCLIALARRGDVSVLLVALNAPNRWWESAALLDQAFAAAPGPATPAR